MIVSEGKATKTEIEQNWTYSDMLECLLYSDIEAVREFKAAPKQKKSQEEIYIGH